MQDILIGFGVSLLVTLILAPVALPLLRKMKFGQTIRAEGPDSHMVKTGTPTMGGVLFLIGMAFGVLFLVNDSKEGLAVLLVALGFGFIGFIDDYIKVVLKRSLGLRAREKLFGQVLVAAGLAYWVVFLTDRGTAFVLPFSHWLTPGGVALDFGWWFFLVFTLLLAVGMANAVNLTDGLDGLAAGSSCLAACGMVVIAMIAGNSGVAVSMAAMAGGCLGFLYYNWHPAKLFMGDTGSLALGGGLAAAAVVTGSELCLLLVGGIFIVETLSVIIQVISFQIRGKRIFRMSPLHHHFELSGWSEKKVVQVFWGASLIFVLVGMAGFSKV
jgi:phospho-N-acetylmuramoyl-pentapeptide-transferase